MSDEHPIIFSGAMVQAILDGRKTQTRRVCCLTHGNYKPSGYGASTWPEDHGRWGVEFHDGAHEARFYPCRYGKPGDRLWVRETWQGKTDTGLWWHEVKPADRPLYNWAWTNPVEPVCDDFPPRWLPSIHMPRKACRITLEVVNVRVERLRDICEDDAKAEGWGGYQNSYVGDDAIGNGPRTWFRKLWDTINTKRGYGWDVNPWVWVIEFRPA